MRELFNSDGSFGYGETSGTFGDSQDLITRKELQKLIRNANAIPLSRIFKYFGLPINESNRKGICPFKSHKNGKESSPSFYFYPETNSYCCYGCRIGSHSCDFVAEMEGISKLQAAHKIIKDISNEIDEDFLEIKENVSEQLEIMMIFTNAVREFHQSKNDFEFIENICSIYDDLNLKHKSLTNDALRHIVSRLTTAISNYKG